LTGTSAAETGRAQETQKIDRGGHGQASRTGGAGSDSVQLSGALGKLSQTLSSFHQDRANRVQALAAQYQSGNYRPDSAATSRGMVSEALAAGMK
jgi:anti-sigma28 factor (negative regulator of flagellin synthesis)